MARHNPTRRPSWPHLLLSSAVSVALLGVGFSVQAAEPASIAEATRSFDIPAQRLNSALLSFSRQTGVDVIFDGTLPDGLYSQPINGEYSSSQALALLLQDSGLSFEQVNPHTLRLVRYDSVGNTQSLMLAPISVTGQHSSNFDNYRQPGPVYSVSREQLDRVPYSRPGDIFDSVPGVSAASSTNGAGLQLNIRGMQGMGRVKTTVDGSIQNVSTYKGYPGNREDTYVDPDLIGGIEIKKGPDAGPQGAGVVGGVVNMRTLNASDLITDPDKNWGIRIKGMQGNNIATGSRGENEYGDISYTMRTIRHPDGTVTRERIAQQSVTYRYLDRSSGQFHSYAMHTENGVPTRQDGLGYRDANIGGALPEHNRAASIAAAWRPLDNWEITVAHALRQSGNYHSGSRGKNSWKGLRSNMADTEVFNTSLNSETWLLKSKVTFLEDHSLELGHIKYRNQSGYFNDGSFLQGRWQEPLNEAETATYTANYAWQPDSPWFDVRANLWKSRVTTDLSVAGTAWGMDPKLRTDLPTVSTDALGGELWNTTSVLLPVGELSLKYGGSFSSEKADGKDAQYPDRSDIVARGERNTLGGFTQAEWAVTPWLTLNAGLQYTRVDLEDGRGVEKDRTLSATDPSYGLVIQPHQTVQLFAQWGHGSRGPTIREAFINAYSVVPNANLKMEKARNFEYGVNLNFGGLLRHDDQLGIKFSKFKNSYDDYIVRLHRGAMGEQNFTDAYKFANIDKARYEGYEIAADYDIGWAFAHFSLTHFDKVEYCYPGFIDNGWVQDPATNAWVQSFTATPTQCHSQPNQNDYGGNYVPPRQEKNAGLGVRLFDKRLVLGGNMKMSTDSMYGGAFRGQYNGTTVWDNYEVYDLYGSLQATKNLEIGFSVENVTDRFYIPSYSSSGEALPAPGRTARGTLTLSF